MTIYKALKIKVGLGDNNPNTKQQPLPSPLK